MKLSIELPPILSGIGIPLKVAKEKGSYTLYLWQTMTQHTEKGTKKFIFRVEFEIRLQDPSTLFHIEKGNLT